MGKVSQKSTKYVIKAELKSSGIVEKPDVVGAIFGQTEGLLDEEMDLRELQERGRIGRIDVRVSKKNGSSHATIEIPSSLDAANTAILAAALETIERVGPTTADIEVEEIRDERVSKRDYIVKRAKQLMGQIRKEGPERKEITDEVRTDLREKQLTEYRGFEAGPDVESSEEVILVEGRADLLNLLRHGVKNALALGGTSVPEKVTEAVADREVTAFLDGDRGGDLILKELEGQVELSYVTRAPEDKEVEELGKEQVYRALRDREPPRHVDAEAEEDGLETEKKERFEEILAELVGTRAVHVLDSELETVEKLPLDSAHEQLDQMERCHAVVFDGEIDNQLVEKAENAGAKYLVGMKDDGYANSSKLETVTRDQLKLKA